MSGRSKLEHRLRARSIQDSIAARTGSRTEADLRAWAEGIRDRFVAAAGQANYDSKAAIIRAEIRSISRRKEMHTLEAAMEYETWVRTCGKFSETEAKVLGSMILAVAFLEFRHA